MGTGSDRRSREDAKCDELAGRRAVSIARAASLYDMSKNTMRRILRAEGVNLITKGKTHRVLKDDLIRVMEGENAHPVAPVEPCTPVTLSNADRASFRRASQERSSY